MKGLPTRGSCRLHRPRSGHKDCRDRLVANEIIKSGVGLYPTEINKFIKEITTVGTSLEYGASLFA